MIEMYVDGACSGNPGAGGYGVVIIKDGMVQECHSAFCEHTTNNREELKAIIYALEFISTEEIPQEEQVIIYSDSAYCVNACNSWIFSWVKNNWKNSKKEEVKNIDLFQTIYKYLTSKFLPCQIVKVSGHSGNPYNELADALATGNQRKFAQYKAQVPCKNFIDFF